MSDQGARSPDQFVKRSWTLNDTIANAGKGSTLALIAYYIGECFTAHRLVAPSNEMIIVCLAAIAPFAHGVYLVYTKRFNDWMTSQGVGPQ